jgi:hypothetical protein
VTSTLPRARRPAVIALTVATVLRATGADAAGGTITQTISNAYRIRT